MGERCGELTPVVRGWTEMDSESKIFAERQRLSVILGNVPRAQMDICVRLIDRAAFMLVSLEKYEEVINRDGIITEMQQGDYTIERENPAAKGYNTMIKNYQAVLKQLTELLPDKRDDALNQAGERLAAFVAAGKGKK